MLSPKAAVNKDKAITIVFSLSDPMYLKMQQNLMEKHEAEKEGES